ncbi:DUF4189 domain-containing protein [Nocardia bovistercoris]|uniref:DUF4189 domain-containing protein n=1 Tax=Nocardia bovistercoris TaxID=2785916 RepID=A0A931IFH5_9NOCA|nr:DUF4189 domain-containing protein [Nocardia bovistercoris]
MKTILTAVVAVAAAFAALATSVPAAQAQTGFYGAIAVGSNGRYSISNNYASYNAAEINAVNSCGPGCAVSISWRNGCGVLARSATHWSSASRSSYPAARDAALSRVYGGRVVNWRCTEGYSS